MILAFDSSTAACTAALFDARGACVRSRDELIGRGHAERLVPMVAELIDGMRPERLIVGVGPGSFTGLRVAIAAAHGMAIGWDAELAGMSSLALLAAGVDQEGAVAVALAGGHGELFVQQFDELREPVGELANLTPQEAAAVIEAELVVGSGAEALVQARGWGRAQERWPSAASAFKIPTALRSLAPRPLYGRAPDARVPQAA